MCPRSRAAAFVGGVGVGVVGAVTVAMIATAVAIGTEATASAAPSDSSLVSFNVVGATDGGLHLSVAREGGLALPTRGGSAGEVLLPRVVVHDNRGGGPRDWSASVAAVGIAQSWKVSYRVTALRSPETGVTLNRMPDLTEIRAVQEAVVSTGISGLSETSTWEPRLRVGGPSAGTGSADFGSSGSLGTGSSSSIGDPKPPARGALLTSAL